MNDKLYTPKQVADFLQVDFRTVYALLRAGKIKGIKVGRVWRISQAAIDDFLKYTSKE